MLLVALDLLLGAVQIGVIHRVSPEAVGPKLQEGGAVTVTHLRHRPAGCVLNRDHVHPVDRPRGHLIARRFERQIGLRLVTIERRAHRIPVVLAAEEHRQPPECCQVHALVKLTLGDCAVPEEAGRHAPATAQLVGQREADRER